MLGLYFAGPTIQFTNLSGLACLFWGNRIECCGIHLCGDFIISKVNRVNKWWWFWDSNHQLRTTGLNALELIHIRDWVFSGVITIIITCKYVKLLNKDGVKVMFFFFQFLLTSSDGEIIIIKIKKACQPSGFNLHFLPLAAPQKHQFVIALYIWCQDINVPSALYKKILFANNYLLRLCRLKADCFHFPLFPFQLCLLTEHLLLGRCFYLKWPKYHPALLFFAPAGSEPLTSDVSGFMLDKSKHGGGTSGFQLGLHFFYHHVSA